MPEPQEHSVRPVDAEKLRVATTYNAAADHFDDDPLAFWERFGRGTVDRLALRRGDAVLDVACGSGASALPAAERVGPTGKVLGVDLADRLLALGRAKAAAQGLSQVEFRLGDMEQLEFAAESFQTVICVFGIFFVTDIAGLITALWRLLCPGGQLAITTWGPRMFEPGSACFWQAVQQERPDLYRSFNPWDRITDPGALRQVMREAGIDDVAIVAEAGTQVLSTLDDFWTIALGSGYRGTIDQLAPDARTRVRESTLAQLRAQDLRTIEVNVIYAVAMKPA
jgi:ubiquinone/menaquinone biosynthesis C-methylase UbiE